MNNIKYKNITFLALNASYSHSLLSYGYLRAFTEKYVLDAEWTLIERTVNHSEDEILKALIDTAPDLITGTLYLFNHEFLLRVIRQYKELFPDTLIVLGGPECLGKNEDFLRRNKFIDAVIRGDESSFFKILKASSYSEWNNIQGLCFIDDKNCYIDNGFANFTGKADEIPSPFAAGYFDADKPFSHFETSRGCMGSCSFCTSALSDSVLNFSLKRVRDDLLILREAGITEIRLIDRTFNEKESRALELLTLFRDEFPEISFHLEINPARLTDTLLEKIKSFPPGKLHIEVGIQSCSNDVLRVVKRYGSVGKSLSGLKKLCELRKKPYKLQIHSDLIAGLPLQTLDDVYSDIDTLIGIMPEEIQLEVLKVLPGTPVACNPPQGLAWNHLPPYNVLRTSHISFEELLELKFASFLLDSYYNTPALHSLFAFCINRNLLDFREFLLFYRERFPVMQKKSPVERFFLLRDFLKNEEALELLKFSWLAAGLPIAKYAIKSFTLSEDNSDGKLIWSLPGEHPLKRSFQAEFTLNVADLWLEPDSEILHGTHNYQFYTAYGNRITAIKQLP